MRLTYHPEAEAELIEAARFYDQRVEGLGDEFLAAFDAAVKMIRSAPDRWPVVDGDRRKYRMRRFPYAILYRVKAGEIRILAVRHHKRHPGHGKDRD